MRVIFLRTLYLAFCMLIGYYAGPQLAVGQEEASYLGVFIGTAAFIGVYVIERVVQRSSPYALLGGCMGVIAAIMMTLILRWALGFENMPITVNVGILAVCSHIGFLVGARAVRVIRLAISKPGLTSSISPKVLDTSAIIDGRIVDMVELGFLGGPLVVPQFVLNETQAIADSSDPIRRARGRRGLGILERLQSVDGLEMRMVDEDYPRVKEVDGKIVAMAKDKRAMIVTTDFNLTKVAELQGIRVLNVHELSQAVRPVVLPGEQVRVTIQKTGKEPGQGVGYLEDGTMVVIEDGIEHMDESVEPIVTSVLQTSAGRMIFARMAGSPEVAEAKPKRRVWQRRA